jgi:hypothetical protein
VRSLRQQSEEKSAFPAVLMVFQEGVEDGREFFARLWPRARGISDPDRKLYRGFGVEMGTPLQLFHPGVLVAGIKSTLGGTLPGVPSADVRQMPGWLLVRNGAVVWRHRPAHAGDHPDLGWAERGVVPPRSE